MLDYHTIKLMRKTWMITKIVLGMASIAGAGWAVKTIFEKSHRSPVEEGFAKVFANNGIEAPPAPKKDEDKAAVEPRRESPVRSSTDRQPSPEAMAVLAQVTATRPVTYATPEPSAKLESDTSSSPAVVPPPPAPMRSRPVEPVARSQRSAVDLPVSIQPMEVDAPEVRNVAKVFDRFRQTPGWWDRMAIVRTPGRVASAAHSYYDVRRLADPVTERLVGAARFDVGEESFIQLAYVSSSRWSRTIRVNFVLPPNAEPQIDWESFVAYSDMDWQQFTEKRVDQPTLMRAYVAIDDYYNYEFSDRERFVCAKLTSADGKHTLYGYSERHSSEGEALKRMTSQLATMLLDGPLPMTGNGPTVPLTAEIAFPSKAQTDKCVRIHRIISNRWVLSDAELAELDRARQTSATENRPVVEK